MRYVPAIFVAVSAVMSGLGSLATTVYIHSMPDAATSDAAETTAYTSPLVSVPVLEGPQVAGYAIVRFRAIRSGANARDGTLPEDDVLARHAAHAAINEVASGGVSLLELADIRSLDRAVEAALARLAGDGAFTDVRVDPVRILQRTR